MSREIKFRDFEPELKKMRYFNLEQFDREEHNSYGNIMQYTGLKDKNDKKIFEGDIITVFDYCDDGDIITTKASEVKFKNGSFGFKNDITRDFYSFSNRNRPGTSFKIIGNKFENPELITEVKNG